MKHDDLTNKGFVRNADGSYSKRSAGSSPQSPVAEQAVRHEPVAEKKRKTCDSGRFQVRVTSFRNRLLDPDNLCAKYFIDCLRYAEIIPNDRQEDIKLEVTQEKRAKQDECTVIEITNQTELKETKQ